MRITILFGGTNKERLVSVASSQALHEALAEADLWFWDADDSVYETSGKALLAHARPFEDPFKPDGRRVASSIEQMRPWSAHGRVIHVCRRRPEETHGSSLVAEAKISHVNVAAGGVHKRHRVACPV